MVTYNVSSSSQNDHSKQKSAKNYIKLQYWLIQFDILHSGIKSEITEDALGENQSRSESADINTKQSNV